MYKKLFTVLFAVALIFGFTGMASADCPFGGVAFGGLNENVSAYGGGLDWDYQRIPNGIAGGIGGAYGTGQAEANGFVFDGTVSGHVTAVGGGITHTESYRFRPGIGDIGIGVGSFSESHSITGASAWIGVDPNDGFGWADARISGFTDQGTLNGSILGASPLGFWESDGFTGGVAGQGSFGGFYGYASVDSGSDDYYGGEDGDAGYYVKIHGNKNVGKIKYFESGHPQPQGNNEWMFLGSYYVDSYATAGVGSEIEMGGYSYSDSYRYIDWGCGYKTEGMGTFVGTATYVNSYGYAYNYDGGYADSWSYVGGGWFAAGGAASYTTQNAPGLGGATASAIGYYVGAGGLNTNFNGSATGYTGTTVTTFTGMNGSINTAQAGMSVSSTVSHNYSD